jgi:hypothetical protein
VIIRLDTARFGRHETANLRVQETAGQPWLACAGGRPSRRARSV